MSIDNNCYANSPRKIKLTPFREFEKDGRPNPELIQTRYETFEDCKANNIELNNIMYYIRVLDGAEFYKYTLELFKSIGTTNAIRLIKSVDRSLYKQYSGNMQILLSCSYYVLGINRRPQESDKKEQRYLTRVTEISEDQIKGSKIESNWFKGWKILGTKANIKMLHSVRSYLYSRR